MRIGSALAIAVLLVGCGGDGGESLGPAPPDLDGHWTFNWTNMSGTVIGVGTFACNVNGVNATLTQVDNTFSGQTSGGLLTCLAGGETASENLGDGVITNGIISGNRVSFYLATEDASQTGSISGNSMSGQATWRTDFGAPYGIVVMRGNWGAVRTQATAIAVPQAKVSGSSNLTAAVVRLVTGR
jgi:hypothetical protein